MAGDTLPGKALDTAMKQLSHADLGCYFALNFLGSLDLKNIMGNAFRMGLIDRDDYDQMFNSGIDETGLTIADTLKQRREAEKALYESLRNLGLKAEVKEV